VTGQHTPDCDACDSMLPGSPSSPHTCGRRRRNSAGQYEPGPRLPVAVLVKCSREERERWQAQAEAEGLTLSALVRRLLGKGSAVG
jgi:hypothetical protein